MIIKNKMKDMPNYIQKVNLGLDSYESSKKHSIIDKSRIYSEPKSNIGYKKNIGKNILELNSTEPLRKQNITNLSEANNNNISMSQNPQGHRNSKNQINIFPNLEPIFVKKVNKITLKKSDYNFTNNNSSNSVNRKQSNILKLFSPEKSQKFFLKNNNNQNSMNISKQLNPIEYKSKINLKVVNTELVNDNNYNSNYSRNAQKDVFNYTPSERNNNTSSNNINIIKHFNTDLNGNSPIILHHDIGKYGGNCISGERISTDKSTMKESTVGSRSHGQGNPEDLVDTPEELHFYFVRVIQGGKAMERRLASGKNF